MKSSWTAGWGPVRADAFQRALYFTLLQLLLCLNDSLKNCLGVNGLGHGICIFVHSVWQQGIIATYLFKEGNRFCTFLFGKRRKFQRQLFPVTSELTCAALGRKN